MHKFYKNSDNKNFFVSEKLAAAQRFSTKKASRTVGTTGARFHKAALQCVWQKKEKSSMLSFFRSFVQPTPVLSDVRGLSNKLLSRLEPRTIDSWVKQNQSLEWFFEWSQCHSLCCTSWTVFGQPVGVSSHQELETLIVRQTNELIDRSQRSKEQLRREEGVKKVFSSPNKGLADWPFEAEVALLLNQLHGHRTFNFFPFSELEKKNERKK